MNRLSQFASHGVAGCRPSQIARVDSVKVVIVDDGSADETSVVARARGVSHVVRHPYNRGLAAAFQSGIDAALRLGADLAVETSDIGAKGAP